MKVKTNLSRLTSLVLTCLLLGHVNLQYGAVRSNPGLINRVLPQGSVTSEKRFALVIGNSVYQHAAGLPNPKNDATDMASVLRELGFEVFSGIDQNKKQMMNLIRQFGEVLASNGGIGLFYYAGHGVRVKGENYLIPVEADIPEENEVEYAAIPVSLLTAKLNAANNAFNIVILDACRNNPFARSWRNFRDIGEHGGLAGMVPPTGGMILYAAQPGSVAADGDRRNGLFTEALLKYIKRPDLEYEQMTRAVSLEVYRRSNKKQLPYKEGTQLVDFYFVATLSNVMPVETAAPILSLGVRPDTSPGCDNLRLDLYKGTMNGLAPTVSQTEVKRLFPCFTGETREGSDSNNGGGVFFLKHNFNFYTYEDQILVWTGFAGSVTPDLLGKRAKTVTDTFGKPKYSESGTTPALGAFSEYYYTMSYGCLFISTAKGYVDKIGVYYKSCRQVR